MAAPTVLDLCTEQVPHPREGDTPANEAASLATSSGSLLGHRLSSAEGGGATSGGSGAPGGSGASAAGQDCGSLPPRFLAQAGDDFGLGQPPESTADKIVFRGWRRGGWQRLCQGEVFAAEQPLVAIYDQSQYDQANHRVVV